MFNLFSKKVKYDVELINEIPQQDLDYMMNLIEKGKRALDKELERLGRGAYGTVYGYKDYAIKILNGYEEGFNSCDAETNDGDILEGLQSVKYVPKLYAKIENRAIIVSRVRGLTVSEYVKAMRNGKCENFINPSFNTAFEEALKDVVMLGYKPYDLHDCNVMIDYDNGLPIIVDVGLFSRWDKSFKDRNSIDLRDTYPTSDAMYYICDSLSPYIRRKQESMLVC